MRPYEIVYITRPDLTDEERAGKIERIHSLITENGGEIEKTDNWGKRVMAYEIRHYAEGHYGLTEFQLPPQSVDGMRERLNLDEDILRYQIVQREG